MRTFIKKVEESALGVQVIKGIKPDQQLVKVVNDQLIDLMGGQKQELVEPKKGPQASLQSNTCLPTYLSPLIGLFHFGAQSLHIEQKRVLHLLFV